MSGQRDASPRRARAYRLLQHYGGLWADGSEHHWNSDNLAELEIFVDQVIEAAKDELRAELADAIRDHAEQAPHLHADGSS